MATSKRRRRRRNHHPYVDMRPQGDGSVRPRFKPDDSGRALGFTSFDLRHQDGAWFTFEEACGFAASKAAELRDARAAGVRTKAPPSPRGRSVRDLLDDFLQSGRFRRPRHEGGYSAKTRADYRQKADAVLYRPQSFADRRSGRPRELEEFAKAPAAAIVPGSIYNDEDGAFFGHLRRTRGLATARGAVMVLSAAYKWAAKATGWGLRFNPCLKLGLPKPKASPQEWSAAEIRAFVAGADHPAIGEHELADFVFLTVYSGGQRESDVMDFCAAHEVEAVQVIDGRRTHVQSMRLVQSKRQRSVDVKKLPRLVERLAQMAARRAQHDWPGAELVIDTHTGRGFNQSTLQKRFRSLRARVAAGEPELGLAACPSIADKTIKQLRATVLSWIKRAGARDNQFVAVSGHAQSSLAQVLPHYYTPGAEEAREAMDLLWTYMVERDMAV